VMGRSHAVALLRCMEKRKSWVIFYIERSWSAAAGKPWANCVRKCLD
jgi:hypothetical protein